MTGFGVQVGYATTRFRRSSHVRPQRFTGGGPTPSIGAFPAGGHSLVFDRGWREVAETVLEWVRRQDRAQLK
ncbi:hypothetical protein GCM10023193_81620 [Planotetraspora kaengkrachanensis]|uniref:Uncharacterized protein n=1 Tax=Planotetraspora kaengkrachanensis TaxID=575193 RepID=A0A8J3VBZ9_9ACTN|nr:hypothetical protein Pka01_71560 [Planotetraspora kaengkrachanensis]